MTKRIITAAVAGALVALAASSADARSYHGRGAEASSARSITKHARSASSGTSRACLSGPARALLGRIEAQFGSVQIISTCRPGARIAGTGKVSRHASGNAIDFAVSGGKKAQVVKWLIANHRSGGVMTYRDMSHIHVDIGSRFVSLGANSHTRG